MPSWRRRRVVPLGSIPAEYTPDIAELVELGVGGVILFQAERGRRTPGLFHVGGRGVFCCEGTNVSDGPYCPPPIFPIDDHVVEGCRLEGEFALVMGWRNLVGGQGGMWAFN